MVHGRTEMMVVPAKKPRMEAKTRPEIGLFECLARLILVKNEKLLRQELTSRLGGDSNLIATF
jgi:hypothetical protein